MTRPRICHPIDIDNDTNSLSRRIGQVRRNKPNTTYQDHQRHAQTHRHISPLRTPQSIAANPQTRSLLQESSNGCRRINATGLTPIAEFSQVHPSVGRFAVMDPGLGFLEPLPNSPLGKSCLFANGSQQIREMGVTSGMLGFGRHGRRECRRFRLTLVMCQLNSNRQTRTVAANHVDHWTHGWEISPPETSGCS